MVDGQDRWSIAGDLQLWFTSEPPGEPPSYRGSRVVAEIPGMVERAEAGELPVNEERAVWDEKIPEVGERAESRRTPQKHSGENLNELPEFTNRSER